MRTPGQESGKQPSNRTHGVPVAVLRRGEAERITAGHPWVYAGAIARVMGQPKDGQAVWLWDHRERFLGTGLFNSQSRIRLRVVSPQRVEVDAPFIESRIGEALAHRRRHYPEATSFRVVNSEADFLSGLIVDKYGDVLVLQTPALAMDQRKQEIATVLEKIFAPQAIVERNDLATRRFEGLADSRGVFRGEIDGPVSIEVNGLSFKVDLLGGHKTGFYLDQQRNYGLVAALVARTPGAAVLDCFSFTGGFGLHAARAGAARVHFLDQSTEAIAAAEAHAETNGLRERCSFEASNVFDWLKRTSATVDDDEATARYDGIVLDPPSFTRNRAAVPDALRGYKEIHLRALKLLKRGGVLATFCCSHHVDATTFQDAILSAAFDSRRVLRRIATFSQAPDHPIIPSIPETEYLKGFAFEVV